MVRRPERWPSTQFGDRTLAGGRGDDRRGKCRGVAEGWQETGIVRASRVLPEPGGPTSSSP